MLLIKFIFRVKSHTLYGWPNWLAVSWYWSWRGSMCQTAGDMWKMQV